jgi:hypothetical protein
MALDESMINEYRAVGTMRTGREIKILREILPLHNLTWDQTWAITVSFFY